MGLEGKANSLDGHHWRVLSAYDVRHAKAMPKHEVTAVKGSVALRPVRQPVGHRWRALIRPVAAGESLCGVISTHPQLPAA